MIPLVMTTFGKLGPSAESYLKSLADVACSTGFVDRGVWLHVVKQFLSCALVRVVALCFVITTRVLRSVLGKTIVMVLLCHSSECGCFVCFA